MIFPTTRARLRTRSQTFRYLAGNKFQTPTSAHRATNGPTPGRSSLLKAGVCRLIRLLPRIFVRVAEVACPVHPWSGCLHRLARDTIPVTSSLTRRPPHHRRPFAPSSNELLSSFVLPFIMACRSYPVAFRYPCVNPAFPVRLWPDIDSFLVHWITLPHFLLNVFFCTPHRIVRCLHPSEFTYLRQRRPELLNMI
jgi:hypothetical protein